MKTNSWRMGNITRREAGMGSGEANIDGGPFMCRHCASWCTTACDGGQNFLKEKANYDGNQEKEWMKTSHCIKLKVITIILYVCIVFLYTLSFTDSMWDNYMILILWVRKMTLGKIQCTKEHVTGRGNVIRWRSYKIRGNVGSNRDDKGFIPNQLVEVFWNKKDPEASFGLGGKSTVIS